MEFRMSRRLLGIAHLTPREPDKGDSPDLQALSTLGAGSALGDLS